MNISKLIIVGTVAALTATSAFAEQWDPVVGTADGKKFMIDQDSYKVDFQADLLGVWTKWEGEHEAMFFVFNCKEGTYAAGVFRNDKTKEMTRNPDPTFAKPKQPNSVIGVALVELCKAFYEAKSELESGPRPKPQIYKL